MKKPKLRKFKQFPEGRRSLATKGGRAGFEPRHFSARAGGYHIYTMEEKPGAVEAHRRLNLMSCSGGVQMESWGFRDET